MQLLTELLAQPPDAVAVDFEGATLSYGDLRDRMAALGAELQRRGLGPGDRVAMLLPHGRLEPAVPLAIWAAGCVAVPLDLHWPLGRIVHVLERTGARLLVGRGQRGKALSGRLGWPERTVLTDGPDRWPGARLEGLVGGPLQIAQRDPEDVASILFTSGSTGTPKGVTLTRRNVDVFAAHWAEELGLGIGDRVAHSSDLAFDLSLFEVGATLSSGATVVPVPEARLAFREGLARWVPERAVTVWYSVPSLLVGMVRAGLDEAGSCLRAVLYAGERLGEVDAMAVRRAFPSARLWNLFGPTETNVSCAWELPRGYAGDVVPIGPPCPYLEVRLLEGGIEADEGEIIAAGGTVMAGYWGEPDRATWVERHGRRWLRTGDRARRREDGALLFLGRMDRMIKVSGYRVEPGAVEAILMRQGVTEASVFAWQDGSRASLAAAVAGPADPESLRRAVGAKLPAYAVPERVLVFDALPRTHRGKVDHEALLARLGAGRSVGGPEIS